MKKINLLIVCCLFFTTANSVSQEIEVWVSDAGGFNNPPWFIYKTDANGNNLEAVMNQADQIKWPQDIVFLEDQNMVLISNITATNPATGYISKHNIDTGEFLDFFAQDIAGATRMKVGADGLLYVLQWSSTDNKVLRYELDGTFIDEFTSNGVSQSIGLDWDADNNLYVSSYGGNSVQKFDPDGNYIESFISSGLSGPTNIFFDPNGSGDLIVLNWNNGRVKRFDSDGNFIEDVIVGLTQPEGVAFYPNGDILIGNGGDGAIKRYDSDFNFIENFVEPGTLLTPNAVVIRDDIPLSIVGFKFNAVFVTPTIGSNFVFNAITVSDYNELRVYNVSGQLINTIVIEDNSSWDASQYSEGLYFITAVKDGKKAVQKIIVKK